jgi:DNA-binding FadR family transcriptional regulator
MQKSLRGPALTETVRDYVKQYILDHNLKEGDPLPKEMQLAQELGVARNSVREAIKALQSLGIVEVRHGQGLYVRAYNMDSIFENFSFGMRYDQNTLKEWLQIRNWLETAIIEESIQNITPEAIHEMEQILEEWARRLEADQPHVDLDERFHKALYSGLKNKTLESFLSVFWIVYKNLEIVTHLTPSREEKLNTLDEHRQMFEGIKQGDTQRVVEYLKRGFTTFQTRLEAGEFASVSQNSKV